MTRPQVGKVTEVEAEDKEMAPATKISAAEVTAMVAVKAMELVEVRENAKIAEEVDKMVSQEVTEEDHWEQGRNTKSTLGQGEKKAGRTTKNPPNETVFQGKKFPRRSWRKNCRRHRTSPEPSDTATWIMRRGKQRHKMRWSGLRKLLKEEIGVMRG